MAVRADRRRYDLILALFICLLTRSSGDQVYRGSPSGKYSAAPQWKGWNVGESRVGDVVGHSSDADTPDVQNIWDNQLKLRPLLIQTRSLESEYNSSPHLSSRFESRNHLTDDPSHGHFMKSWESRSLDQVPDSEASASSWSESSLKRLSGQNSKLQNGYSQPNDEYFHNAHTRELEGMGKVVRHSMSSQKHSTRDMNNIKEPSRRNTRYDSSLLNRYSRESFHRNEEKSEPVSTKSHFMRSHNNLESVEDANGKAKIYQTGERSKRDAYISYSETRDQLSGDASKRSRRDTLSVLDEGRKPQIRSDVASMPLPRPVVSLGELTEQQTNNMVSLHPRRSHHEKENRMTHVMPSQYSKIVRKCDNNQTCNIETNHKNREKRSISSSNDDFVKTLPTLFNDADDYDEAENMLTQQRDQGALTKAGVQGLNSARWIWVQRRLSNLQNLLNQQIHAARVVNNQRKSAYEKRKTGRTDTDSSAGSGWSRDGTEGLRGSREGLKAIWRRNGGEAMSRLTEMLNNYKTKGNKIMPPLETLRFG